MQNQSEHKGTPFKLFLDKSTNLVTLFGVFNALFIYSSTIDSKGAAEFLLPSFFVLSILVWLELILLTVSSNDGSIKYQLFYFLLCSVEIGLVWYFIHKFSSLIFLLTFLGFLFLFVFLFTRVLSWTFLRWLIKLSEKKRDNILYIIILVSTILSGLCIKLILPALKPIIAKVLPNNEPRSDRLLKQAMTMTEVEEIFGRPSRIKVQSGRIEDTTEVPTVISWYYDTIRIKSSDVSYGKASYINFVPERFLTNNKLITSIDSTAWEFGEQTDSYKVASFIGSFPSDTTDRNWTMGRYGAIPLKNLSMQ